MQSQFASSGVHSGRPIKSGAVLNERTPQSVQQAETATPVKRKSQTIEVGQLPMVRKGGGTAIMFDRMDQNGNGVLTRAELISYRLAPMVTHTPAEISPMPAEAMTQVGHAAKARIADETPGAPTDADTQHIEFAGFKSLEAAFGISDTGTGTPTPAQPAEPAPAPLPTAAPTSLPESVVMAQAASAAAPEVAFA